MAWDDVKRAKAIELYEEAGPTAETSLEIVKSVAEELGETANGVRMVLVKAGVYIKAEGVTPKESGKSEAKEGGTRINKASAHAALEAAISAAGLSPDAEIVSKLTGKAAVYFADIITNLTK